MLTIMKHFIIFATTISFAMASGGYGGTSGTSSATNYGSSTGSGYSNSGGNGGQTVQAAIQTRHQIEFRDVPSSGSLQPATIEVGSQSLPLMILFRSSSSSLNVQQAHDSAQGSVQESTSEDEPHRLLHSVTKPIIQEVHEVITPFRKITQEIQPVQEEIQTIVARNVGGQQSNIQQQSTSQLQLGAQLEGILGSSLSSSSKSSGLGSGLKGKTSNSYGNSGSKLTSPAKAGSSSTSSKGY